ncbi:MAG: guanylate kinase [bacterium]|nr:guanylate kinase [bacterium]
MTSLLLVISAPSGTGKTTVCDRLISSSPDITYSISFTTRAPRAGEIEGKHYQFVSEERFKTLIRQGELVEWAIVHGNYYGTPRAPLEVSLSQRKVLVMDIDVQGGIQIRDKYKESVLIFIIPPSLEELKLRLQHRKTDDEETINKRLLGAKEELKYASCYDYYLVNHQIDETVNKLKAIIAAEKCNINRMVFDIWDGVI